MDDFWSVFLVPIFILIVGLIIEYWLIQPLKNAQEFTNIPKSVRRDWGTATTKAIKLFRKRQQDYNGILKRRNTQVENKEVKRGHAVLKIAVSEKRYFWENIRSDPKIYKRFELIIDRSGDILAIRQTFIDDSVNTSTQKGNKTKTKPQKLNKHPNPYVLYLYALVGLLGGGSSLASAIGLYIATNPQMDPGEDILFWFSMVIAIICGAVTVIYADVYFQMDQAYIWQRLPIAAILGAIVGALVLIIIYIGIIILIVWVLILIFRRLLW